MWFRRGPRRKQIPTFYDPPLDSRDVKFVVVMVLFVLLIIIALLFAPPH